MTYSLTLDDSDHLCIPHGYILHVVHSGISEILRRFSPALNALPFSAVVCLHPVTAPPSPNKNRAELLQDTLDILILQTLQCGAQHGYGIVQALRTQSGEVLQVETGLLYPALHRLERQGWVRWERMVAAVSSIMHARPGEGEA